MTRRPAGEVTFGNEGAEICVVGRCDFATGIGAMTYAACEMLSRAYPTCILPTESHRRAEQAIYLPNGRRIPVCQDRSAIKLFLFCDVLWNGAHDTNFLLVPEGALRIAWIVFDSDELPAMWVQILNHRFDLVLTTSPHLMHIAASSGVTTPTACLPIALDLAAQMAAPLPRRTPGRVRFGSVAAFHPRKGVDTLTEGFLRAFAGRPDIDLVLHSNLAFGDTYDRVMALIREIGGTNVTVTHAQLSGPDKDLLIQSFDVMVNCSRGEAYSIGPREALASGCALVLSDVGGHRDLADLPGVFMVPTSIEVPARYPEIDGTVFGRQHAVSAVAVTQALHEAHEFVLSPAFAATLRARRAAAADWSFDGLATAFASLLDEALPEFRRPAQVPKAVVIPPAARAVIRNHLGDRAARLGHINRLVQLAHDGGFFSVFNAFISHVAWQQREPRCHAVLPDWDVGRMMAEYDTDTMTSFCYGQPEDGNLWCHLFQPPFGFTDAELNDPDTMYRRSTRSEHIHNERCEPQMTYVHAYTLYNSRAFASWRRQYHAVFARHIHLRPGLQAEIDAFSTQHFTGRFVIGAHVRHPSHTVEQPGAVIAHEDAYITRIRAELAKRDLGDTGWTVFLATDQDRVVDRFRAEFGDRVTYLTDVRRTRPAEDAAFDSLSAVEKNQDGHQLQHLVAADRSAWSIDMAKEVVRDAWLMSRCNMLLHVVSNVSTAVSYMNPDLEMVFCAANP
ncbi:glycosyltransferase [Acidisphaera sp. L21]|uniref:glycosyltransferase n=1 Tax=Acidisphaera sp. L21 TaxID=1641851 RepID=UPI001C20256A|nr:glycosyltransferase [Acidisphaera sp. L21]